jgi:Na+/proline symporter
MYTLNLLYGVACVVYVVYAAIKWLDPTDFLHCYLLLLTLQTAPIKVAQTHKGFGGWEITRHTVSSNPSARMAEARLESLAWSSPSYLFSVGSGNAKGLRSHPVTPASAVHTSTHGNSADCSGPEM